MKISEQIENKQALIVTKKDAQVLAVKAMELNPTDDGAIALVDQLSEEIEAETKSLASLQRAEAALASSANHKSAQVQTGIFSDPKNPADLFVKSATAILDALYNKIPLSQAVTERYGSFKEFEQVKAISDTIVNKAAQNPAFTNVVSWAQELTRVSYGAFMDLLTPESVVANLPMMRFSFDGASSIILPNRANKTKNLAGAFRAEGAPIRVGAAVLGSNTLTPKSMGIIGSFSNELFRRSNPNIEAMIRKWMIEDTSEALDTAFLDATASSSIRPAGIQNAIGAGNTAASQGNTSADITADARARLQAMAASLTGRNPYWLMNPQRWIGVQTSLTPAGTLAFPEAQAGRFMGYPVLTSLNVPSDIVFLVDASELDFAGGMPEFYASDVATIHEEDTTPLPLATGVQGSGVVATPQRSLYQTNSAALRCVWELDWLRARVGSVQTITACAW